MYDVRAYVPSVWLGGLLSSPRLFQVVPGEVIARRREFDGLFQESFRFDELAAFGQSPPQVVQEMVIVWVERQGAALDRDRFSHAFQLAEAIAQTSQDRGVGEEDR